MKQKQCDRCGTIFDGTIGMCPSCGSTMTHEYEQSLSETVSEAEETEVQENTVSQDGTVNEKSKVDGLFKGGERDQTDHYDRKNKFALLRAQNIFWSWFLMEIPVIGWLVAVFWSFGLGVKRQRRELARAFLVRLVIGLFLLLLGLALYKWVFRLTLNDLPGLISKAYEWVWKTTSNIIDAIKK